MKALTHEQFVGRLRSALHYLYDPVHLRTSPLIDILNLAAEFDTAAALQRALIDAVGALKPTEDEPPQSRSWRVYDTLNLQYVRRFSQETVATQLGISGRQLRRERRIALEALTQYLWAQHSLSDPATAGESDEVTNSPVADGEQALSEELVWLKDANPEQVTSIGDVLHTVVDLVQPLADKWNVPLQIDVQAELSNLLVAQLALRSILLTVLNVAIPRAGRGPMAISVELIGSELQLKAICLDTSRGVEALQEDIANLETTQNLAAHYGARLVLQHEQGAGFVFTLTFSMPERINVLVIDDNADWLDLLQRYAADSRFQVKGTNDPQLGCRWAEELQPAVILLDVMMQSVDGWEILSALRHEPMTSDISVIICTVLPVRDLALALGADAFLQKPVKQEHFLGMLEQHVLSSG